MITSLESKAIKPQCELCGKYFKTKGNLKVHIVSVHESSKYPCDMCVYEAPNRYSLKEHKDALHKRVKYPCNQCHYQPTLVCNLASRPCRPGRSWRARWRRSMSWYGRARGAGKQGLDGGVTRAVNDTKVAMELSVLSVRLHISPVRWETTVHVYVNWRPAHSR